MCYSIEIIAEYEEQLSNLYPPEVTKNTLHLLFVPWQDGGLVLSEILFNFARAWLVQAAVKIINKQIDVNRFTVVTILTELFHRTKKRMQILLELR